MTLDHPLAWILGLALTGCLLAAGTFLIWHMVSAHARRAERRERRDDRDLGRPNAWVLPLVLPWLLASAASAQLLTPGAATFPSPPLGRTFLDQPVATCVIAVPCPYGDCVILKPCPPHVAAAPTPPIAAPPTVQPVATPPIATPPAAPPSAAPLPAPSIVIQCPPVPTPKAAPVPKAAPPKCPAC